MSDTTAPVRAFELQSGACAAFGSPFSAGLLEAAARDIAAGGPLVGLLNPWEGASARQLIGDATAIRWLGCLHDLVLSGEPPELAAAYPLADRAGDLPAAWSAARTAMTQRPDRFVEFMSHEPQTNEVRRSACLLPGFLSLAAETGLPLRLFEIGASAGLNQLWDRYHYSFGEVGSWGDPAAAVRLEADWRGPPPPLDAPVRVAARAACDRKPVDIRDPIARRRLKAYVWADQIERLTRLEGAVALALEADTRVEAEDAVTWVARRAAPTPGAASVIYHSIFWQYMPAESQAAVAAAIADLGEAARADAPLAWLRMEPPAGNPAIVELRLTVWPGGEDRLLGHAHPHGASVEWGS